MIVPSGSSDNGSTGRSAHDDGYGTESGSNQKVHTVSLFLFTRKFFESSNSYQNLGLLKLRLIKLRLRGQRSLSIVQPAIWRKGLENLRNLG